jgi:uncharacterized protein YndB with AHSA1/START domain
MTNVKRVQFHTTIKASPVVVWDAMIGPDTYRRWTSAFGEGSYFEGDWSEGSRIRFLAPPGNGMVAEIAANRPHEFLSIRHLGFFVDGKEDTESETVRAWAPAYENYTLIPVEEGTKVLVDQDLTEEFEKSMEETWPKAFELLRQICEEEGGA